MFESQLLGSFCKQIVPPLTEHDDVIKTQTKIACLLKSPTLRLCFCFSTFTIAVGPAFTFSDFDKVGGLGFDFDVFSITLLFLASHNLLVLNH